MRETINFKGSISEIPSEITSKINIHRKHKKTKTLSDEELTLIDYFLNDNAKIFINDYYPSHSLSFKNFESEDIYNIQKLNKNNHNENLRNMRENLTLISTGKSIARDIEFLKEKITSTLSVIDAFLLDSKESHEEIKEDWCKNVDFISENKDKNENIIKINNEFYIFPQNLGAVDPSQYISKEDFLSMNPEIQEFKK